MVRLTSEPIRPTKGSPPWRRGLPRNTWETTASRSRAPRRASPSAKADPELTDLLRENYPAVRPARYFDKRYWSTLTCDDTVPTEEVVELLDASYDIVFGDLKRSDREALKGAR